MKTFIVASAAVLTLGMVSACAAPDATGFNSAQQSSDPAGNNVTAQLGHFALGAQSDAPMYTVVPHATFPNQPSYETALPPVFGEDSGSVGG